MIKTWSKYVPFLFIARRKICQPLYLYKRKNALIVNCVKKVDIRQNILNSRDDLKSTWSLDWDFSYSLWYPAIREKCVERFTMRVLLSIYFLDLFYMYRIHVRDFRIILRGCSNPTADKRLCISQVFVTSDIWKLAARSFAIRPLIMHISV